MKYHKYITHYLPVQTQPLISHCLLVQLTTTIADQLLVISLVKVKKSKVNYTVLF